MTYYLYHNAGNCDDGSHNCGLQEFGSKEEALAEAERLRAYFLVYDDPVIVVIEGAEILRHE